MSCMIIVRVSFHSSEYRGPVLSVLFEESVFFFFYSVYSWCFCIKIGGSKYMALFLGLY